MFGAPTALTVASRTLTGVPPRRADRRRWVPPLVLMVTASLLLVPAAPVMGVDGVPDHPARYSACVGIALEPAGFRDMGLVLARSDSEELLAAGHQLLEGDAGVDAAETEGLAVGPGSPAPGR